MVLNYTVAITACVILRCIYVIHVKYTLWLSKQYIASRYHIFEYIFLRKIYFFSIRGYFTILKCVNSAHERNIYEISFK